MNTSTGIHPRNHAVATWLLICCALVFAMVVLGGVTRLTGSGLSMVDWRPLMGWLPPLTDIEWQRVFELYQSSPEFQKVNSHMDVHAFKSIFWLEYLHRLLGRTIGIVFLVPFIAFLVKGYIRKSEWAKYLLMFVLGGMQGVLGWYMVKSGLVDVPQVSQYRLTAHLVAAFAIYAFMFWVAMSLLFPATGDKKHAWYPRALALTILTSVTIISGGFVAGLKAGKIYNTFPMMGDYWLPPGLFALEPVWRNFFDNIVTVQLDHRILAITTLIATISFWYYARRADVPARTRPALTALLHTVLIQVILGITTLLLMVPVALGAAHQAVAMLLFTVSLYVLHSLRRVS
ncbi:MAG TPA: COX15/CtaA family protein [Woeseiaceae bacterium]|nr:COX15/CtaA family protein [Woeseiaceae bacterium]